MYPPFILRTLLLEAAVADPPAKLAYLESISCSACCPLHTIQRQKVGLGTSFGRGAPGRTPMDHTSRVQEPATKGVARPAKRGK